MSNSYVQVAPDSTGKKVQAFINTVAGQSVEAQAVALVDANGNPVTVLPVSGPLTDAELRTSPIQSEITGASGTIVDVDPQGHLAVRIHDPLTAFGELSVAQPTPVCQLDWLYGLNTLQTVSTVTGSGSVTSSDRMALCNTTAAASSSGQLTSRRYLKYRPGQGGMGRFTAIFTAGIAGATQYAGLGTSSLANAYMFGYSGATFGIWYNNNGSASHIAQTTWNVDVMDGTGSSSNPTGMLLDPTKGNVYQVKFQYLGFGAIFFFIENSTTGAFEIVHIIRYANLNTVPNVAQPSLSLIFRAANDGTNSTAITVKTASAALFVEGTVRDLGLTYGSDATKTTVTTEVAGVSIRNCATYNGVANRAQLKFRIASFGSNTGGAVSGVTTLKAVLNTTLGGSPAFAAINGTTADNGVTITGGLSVSSYDTAGTTLTGGTQIFNAVVAVGNSATVDLKELELILAPGETMTFSVTSTQSATVGVGITWTEDL